MWSEYSKCSINVDCPFLRRRNGQSLHWNCKSVQVTFWIQAGIRRWTFTDMHLRLLSLCRQIRMKLRSKDIKSRCGCIKGGICKGRWETGWMGPRPLPRTGQTSSRRSRRDLIYFCKHTPTTEKEKGRRTSHLPSTRLTGNRPELLPTHLKKKKKCFLKKL